MKTFRVDSGNIEWKARIPTSNHRWTRTTQSIRHVAIPVWNPDTQELSERKTVSVEEWECTLSARACSLHLGKEEYASYIRNVEILISDTVPIARIWGTIYVHSEYDASSSVETPFYMVVDLCELDFVLDWIVIHYHIPVVWDPFTRVLTYTWDRIEEARIPKL